MMNRPAQPLDHTASVVTALILLSTEPKIDMDYFTVQCTGQYKGRCVNA